MLHIVPLEIETCKKCGHTPNLTISPYSSSTLLDGLLVLFAHPPCSELVACYVRMGQDNSNLVAYRVCDNYNQITNCASHLNNVKRPLYVPSISYTAWCPTCKHA